VVIGITSFRLVKVVADVSKCFKLVMIVAVVLKALGW